MCSPKYNPAQDGLGDEVKDCFDSTPRSKWLIDDGGYSQKAVSRTPDALAGTLLPLYFNSDQKYQSQSSSGQVVAVMQAANTYLGSCCNRHRRSCSRSSTL